MAISKEQIETIRERAQIEEVIRRYVPSLKKRGKNYVGLCPFHKETAPSFSVSPEKQIFYCFGCHAGGNVFSFISKVERIEFPDSVRFVAGLVGIEVKEESRREPPRELDQLKRINLVASDLYHKVIKTTEGKKGLDYLLGRGVTKESIKEFKMGYAPDSWHFLTGHLSAMKIPNNLAEQVGLVSLSEKGDGKNYYDRFRNRIIFPISNQKNEIIAFGGRIIGSGEPKYLNSPESVLFQKRNVLYGFHLAKDPITDLNRAIVVEGYLDVIGCHQAGIRNVVAPLGTALTPEQVKFIARYCGEIILLFDADSAGMKASLRSLEILEDVNVDVKVAVLPEGDPFDFIQKKGMREFMAVADSAMMPVDFKIHRAIADYGSNDKIGLLVKLFEIIKDIRYETERSLYLRKTSTLLGMEENSVRADFKKFLSGSYKSEAIAFQVPSSKKTSEFLARSHRELVVILCQYPELVEHAVIDYTESEFLDPAAGNIFRKLAELYSLNEKISIDKMFDYFTEGDEKELLQEGLSREFRIENPNSAYTEIYINLKLYSIDQKINRYADLIAKSNNAESVNRKEYLTEIEVLRREREKLSSFVYNRGTSVF